MPFPVSRPVPFPLFSIVDGKCGCGQADCARVGKHPAVKWSEVDADHPAHRPEPGAGAGIKTGAHPQGSDVFVVDIDGEDAAALFDELGGAPDTFTVATPRGLHFYFAHPGFPVKNSAGALGKGIDIRGDGGFVVAPGSPHRSGERYQAINELPPADAPAWLLEWLRRQPAPAEAQHYPGDVEPGTDEHARRLRMYTEHCQKAPPAVEGAAGDARLWSVIQHGAYDLALPVDDVLELVRDVFNPRCSPPWSDEAIEERVRHKAGDAKTKSQRPQGEPLPVDLEFLGKPPPSLADAIEDVVADHENNSDKPGTIEEQLPEEIALKVTWGKWDEPLPPPVYIIEHVVPEATIGVIVAKGSSLKTWLVLSMLSSVARGKPWLGHFAVTRGKALLVDFESGRDTIQERVQYLQHADAEGLGIASFPAARIDDAAFWIALAKLVLARGITVVAIDSFAAGAPGVDENDAKSADPLHHAARFIEGTRCSVVLIHHAKKGNESADERDIVRGSGAIYGAADWIYTMIPQDEDRTKMLVRCIKAYRKKPEDFRVKLALDGLELDIEPVDADKQASAQALQAQIRAALARGPIANKALVDKAIGKKSGTASAELDAMVARREVAKLPIGGYTLDYPVARLERLRRAVQVPGLTSPASLAAAAHIDVEEVHEALAAGQLFKSGSGYVMP